MESEKRLKIDDLGEYFLRVSTFEKIMVKNAVSHCVSKGTLQRTMLDKIEAIETRSIINGILLNRREVVVILQAMRGVETGTLKGAKGRIVRRLEKIVEQW